MIVVTGATGKLGRLIVEELLARVGPGAVGVSVRYPGKADDLLERGVRVRHGDYAEPASLDQAFEGATQLLVVSSNARASGGDPIAQHRNVIDAAKAAGVRRIVYTSHMAASPSSAFPPTTDHAKTEAMLAESGIAWTSLRNGFYASTVPFLIGKVAETGLIEAPEDGKAAWTTHADLGAGAAAILVQEGRFNGPTPPLTASVAYDLADVAAMLSEITGRTITRKVISDGEQRERLSERNTPPGMIATTLGMYRAARAGEFVAVNPLLAELIGREPITLRNVLAQRGDG